MNGIVATTSPLAVRCDVRIRVATMADMPFIDALQKQYHKALGYFPTQQLQGYIEMGAVLIAARPHPDPLPEGEGEKLGYIISRDRYLKRDELGVVYQLCVAPNVQRHLVGASLVQGVFQRSAYGCRLYCCWCAQDLEANHFWESMGFAPIAFRAGSGKRRRVHIFWQRRINADDVGEKATPWWYPFQTNAGAMREDRLVFPIPPSVHWSEVQPVALPAPSAPALPAKVAPAPRPKTCPAPGSAPQAKPDLKAMGGLRTASPVTVPTSAKPPRPRKAKAPSPKVNPKHIAAARELRDRYLEHVNGAASLPPARGKYDLSRQLQAPPAVAQETPFLTAA